MKWAERTSEGEETERHNRPRGGDGEGEGDRGEDVEPLNRRVLELIVDRRRCAAYTSPTLFRRRRLAWFQSIS